MTAVGVSFHESIGAIGSNERHAELLQVGEA